MAILPTERYCLYILPPSSQDTSVSSYLSPLTVAGVDTGVTVLKGQWEGHSFLIELEVYEGETQLSNSISDPKDKPEMSNTLINFPNPFSTTTKINFEIKHPGLCTLIVYGLGGKQVSHQTFIYGTPGLKELVFQRATLTEGMYFFRLDTPDGRYYGKMMVFR